MELLDAALERNTVICMGSSSGRMFIAVMLMKEMAKDIRKPLEDGGKRTFFILNTGVVMLKTLKLKQTENGCNF